MEIGNKIVNYLREKLPPRIWSTVEKFEDSPDKDAKWHNLKKVLNSMGIRESVFITLVMNRAIENLKLKNLLEEYFKTINCKILPSSENGIVLTAPREFMEEIGIPEERFLTDTELLLTQVINDDREFSFSNDRGEVYYIYFTIEPAPRISDNAYMVKIICSKKEISPN